MKNPSIAFFSTVLILFFSTTEVWAFDNFLGAGQWNHVAMNYSTSSDLDANHTGKQTVDGESGTLVDYYFHGNDLSGWGMWLTQSGGGGGSGNPSPTGFIGPAWIAYDFGQPYSVKEMLIWNYNQSAATARGMKAVNISISVDGATWSTLFSGNLTQAHAEPNLVPTDTFSVNQEIQFVVIDCTSNYSIFGDTFYGLSEVRWNLLAFNATTPDPADEEVNISVNSVLSWQPGENATGHHLYFGTNYYHVLDASPSNPLGVYQGLQSPGYSPGSLELNKTYYWRVDATDGSTVWKGNVWSFTTIPNVIIEDFDESGSNWPALGTGSTSYSTTVCEGAGAMSLSYSNHLSPYYAAAQGDANSLDTSGNGIQYLSLTYRGAASNGDSHAVLFMELTDAQNRTVRAENPDPNAIFAEDCTQWNVGLNEFVPVPPSTDFDFTDVDWIRVGVGDGQTPAGTTSGTILIDTLAMYPAQCQDPPAGDLTNDCFVDIDDFLVLLRAWLEDNTFPQ